LRTPWRAPGRRGSGRTPSAFPVLIMHGAEDKMVPCAHGERLAARCAAAELRIVADAGYFTVLDSALEALAWLAGLVRA
jgi:pimeloyl-ACP methyl ester carboxylesterase